MATSWRCACCWRWLRQSSSLQARADPRARHGRCTASGGLRSAAAADAQAAPYCLHAHLWVGWQACAPSAAASHKPACRLHARMYCARPPVCRHQTQPNDVTREPAAPLMAQAHADNRLSRQRLPPRPKAAGQQGGPERVRARSMRAVSCAPFAWQQHAGTMQRGQQLRH